MCLHSPPSLWAGQVMCQVVMHAVRKVKEGTAVERGRKESFQRN